MTAIIANNATSRLAGALSGTDEQIALSAGTGSRFPSPGEGEWFPITLIKATGEHEIAHATARAGDLVTVLRGQEGTAAMEFAAGDRAELRLTAAVLADNLVPTGTGPIPWTLPTEPPGWIFADGRVLGLSTPYKRLRALYVAAGFPWGQDGSGNPRIPDARGRAMAGTDGGAGRLSGGTLGAGLGAQAHTLSVAEMPSHGHGVTDPTHAHSVYDPGHAHGVSDPGHRHSYNQATVNDGNVANGTSHTISASANTGTAYTGISINGAGTGIGIYGAGTGISIQANGGGAAHNNVQPTLVANMIVKT